MSLSLVSCGNEDDGGSPPAIVDFTYEGKSYTFNSGYSVDGVEPNFGYYYTDFILGTSSFTLNEFVLPTVAVGDFQMTEAILYVSLLNEGDSFETGTYVFSTTELPKYFDFCYIRLPGENNSFDLVDDLYLFINSGSILVSGTPSNYSLDFNVTIYSGQSVSFTYNSNLVYLDAF